jgi:hypothetical protein
MEDSTSTGALEVLLGAERATLIRMDAWTRHSSFAILRDRLPFPVGRRLRGGLGPLHEDRMPALAAMLGAQRPLRIPRWLARVAAGDHVVAMMTEGSRGLQFEGPARLGLDACLSVGRQGFAKVLPAG